MFDVNHSLSDCVEHSSFGVKIISSHPQTRYSIMKMTIPHVTEALLAYNHGDIHRLLQYKTELLHHYNNNVFLY